MATYNGREVQIIHELPDTINGRVVVEYADSGSTETVSRSLIDFSADEINKQAEADKKKVDERVKEAKKQADEKDKRAKLEVDHRKEVEQASKDGLREDAWLKTGIYKKGDQVTVDGVVYRSRMNDNQGNTPSDKPESGWFRVNQEITNKVPQTDTTTKVPLGKPVVIGDEQNKPILKTNTL